MRYLYTVLPSCACVVSYLHWLCASMFNLCMYVPGTYVLVQQMIVSVFRELWFGPVPANSETETLLRRVTNITAVVSTFESMDIYCPFIFPLYTFIIVPLT